MKDYDISQHRTQLVARVASDKRTLTRRLRLSTGTQQLPADIVVIDAEPARGPQPRQALVEADYALIPAPPEFTAVTAMEHMLATVEEVRRTANPYLAWSQRYIRKSWPE